MSHDMAHPLGIEPNTPIRCPPGGWWGSL